MAGPSNAEVKRHVDWAVLGVVGAIVTLLFQTGAIVWWAASMDRRVSQLERDVLPVSQLATIVARLDERTSSIKDTTDRIEDRIEGRMDRRRSALPAREGDDR